MYSNVWFVIENLYSQLEKSFECPICDKESESMSHFWISIKRGVFVMKNSHSTNLNKVDEIDRIEEHIIKLSQWVAFVAILEIWKNCFFKFQESQQKQLTVYKLRHLFRK